MSNLIQTYFTFFFWFFLGLFDNVSAIRFMLSLVKYHNCFITIFLKEKTGKTYRYKHYLQVKTCSYTPPFMEEETDESRPLFQVNHKKN